ncbi:conserved hypothetical protein [Methanocaldococcus infernus ME]|uniref:Uncharacterized protein n=1 Tax=Methanocaldococcus infernus (strain DSM 11812 / JCM 15783 / ME) TaxID=573063 RepID=D5VU04_METIM|nr:hypothetical protein [Methanocaldococcus infernus]ADG14057.1 conserved hypothetical protein [Methanocaldococcus infernus ME]
MIKNFLFIYIMFLILVFFNYSFAKEEIYVKLVPKEVISNGEIVKLNITIENIPKIGEIKYDNYEKTEDGGCGGVEIYINYSNHLKPYGFNWSNICKKEKLKFYEFKNNTFRLEISFSKPIEEDFCIGEIMFIPVKEGEAQLNISGVVSSALGYKYDGINEYLDYYTKTFKKYPDTKFFGARIIIKKTKNITNTTMKLKEDIEETKISSSTIVNRIYIAPNAKEPKVIVKEINITEYQPIVKIILEKKNNFKFPWFNLLFGMLFGIFFGLIISKFKR